MKDIEDDYNITEKGELVKEPLDEKTIKKQHVKKLKHLLAAQNELLEKKDTTTGLFD